MVHCVNLYRVLTESSEHVPYAVAELRMVRAAKTDSWYNLVMFGYLMCTKAQNSTKDVQISLVIFRRRANAF